MPKLSGQLAPEHSIILANDVSTIEGAEQNLAVAKDAGAWVVKTGLEFMSAHSAQVASEMAADYGLEWVADAKLFDIPHTVAKTVENYAALSHPPVGITIATRSGVKSLRAAQDIAAEHGITMFGVTQLTSVDDKEARQFDKATSRIVVYRETRRAIAGSVGGVVCSAQEIGQVKKFRKTRGLFGLVPGARSEGAATHDQKRSATPGEAIERGAGLLVVGREVTKSDDPAAAYGNIVQQVAAAQQRLKKVS